MSLGRDGSIIVDAARCAHETIDGEVTVIDTPTGHLYLMVGLGSALWNDLVRGSSMTSIADEMRHRYGDDAAADATSFVQQLIDAGLVIDSAHVEAAPPGGTPPDIAWPDTYEPATFERFDDIADIMTIDPLHDVDLARGWPHRRPELDA